MATIKAPIWQDIYYTSTTYTMLEYIINRKGGVVIYAGRAYQRPGGTGISINISKICQDYIKDSFSDTDFRNLVGSTYAHPESYVEFELRDMNGNLLNTYGFVYDWSYENWDGNARTVSNPINNHKMAGMYDFNTVCRTVDDTMELATSVYQVAGGNYCGEIALYYKNRKGGWDSFLIEGTVTKKDEYTKYTYNRSFNNNTLEFENGTYHSQIVTSYVLNTGWLNDQESDNKNNSRKLVNYQINVEESQRKEVL